MRYIFETRIAAIPTAANAGRQLTVERQLFYQMLALFLSLFSNLKGFEFQLIEVTSSLYACKPSVMWPSM